MNPTTESESDPYPEPEPEPESPFAILDSLAYRTVFEMPPAIGELFLRYRKWWKLALGEPGAN